ncbi:hypothetical protein [Jatrophihabitans sp.]|uniref:hypothetical protein n=1 Tax=Jatrophihabitans sp. TaxID=1932789 RepID=UPI0030C67D3A|nr:hypothetical protein [Jatrophihabitans sp.]
MTEGRSDAVDVPISADAVRVIDAGLSQFLASERPLVATEMSDGFARLIITGSSDTGWEQLVENLADDVRAEVLSGVQVVSDESDTGASLRVAITPAKDANLDSLRAALPSYVERTWAQAAPRARAIADAISTQTAAAGERVDGEWTIALSRDDWPLVLDVLFAEHLTSDDLHLAQRAIEAHTAIWARLY